MFMVKSNNLQEMHYDVFTCILVSIRVCIYIYIYIYGIHIVVYTVCLCAWCGYICISISI